MKYNEDLPSDSGVIFTLIVCVGLLVCNVWWMVSEFGVGITVMLFGATAAILWNGHRWRKNKARKGE